MADQIIRKSPRRPIPKLITHEKNDSADSSLSAIFHDKVQFESNPFEPDEDSIGELPTRKVHHAQRDDPHRISYEVTAHTLRTKGFVISATGIMHTPEHHDGLESKSWNIHPKPASPVVELGRPISANDLVELGDLGTGQNGTVVKALHMPELQLVALKSINVHDKSKRHQMVKELMAFSDAKDPHVLSLVGAYFDHDKIHMALEYMNRGSLQQAVRKNGPIPEPILKHITKQILLGLQYLHSKYQVHRDIKPDNILLNHEGLVKISDFGLVKQLKGSQDLCHTFVGTLVYLSPERVTSSTFSFASDIWSLGITLIFCATGALPVSSDYWALVSQVNEQPSPKLNAAKFSPALCSFVDECLQKDPDARPSAKDLLHHEFLNGVPDELAEPCDCSSWPFVKPSPSDERMLVKTLNIMIEKLYVTTEYRNTLVDKARFRLLGRQLGFDATTIEERFKTLYSASLTKSTRHSQTDPKISTL